MQSVSDFGKTEAKAEARQASDSESAFIKPVAAQDNSSIIGQYNNHTLRYVKNKPNGKDTRVTFIMWSIGKNSIISDQNIEISFHPEGAETRKAIDTNGFANTYRISVTNKSDKNIYIDLANCFKIGNDDTSESYFTNSSYTQSSSSGSGASINLGAVSGAMGIGGPAGTLASGVNVGGGKSSGTQITTTEQRILTVPPYGSVSLPGKKVSTGKEFVDVYEDFSIANLKGITSTGLGLKQWSRIDFNEQNSPAHMRRIITYSTRPDFSDYTSLPIELYVGALLGGGGNRFIGPYPFPEEIEGTTRICTIEKLNKK